MSLGRASVISLSATLCVALLAALLPAAAIAAPDAQAREYIVTLAVKDSERRIKPSSRANKVRIRQRARAAELATEQITTRHGVSARYRFGNAVTGFAARMTPAEARRIAAEPDVADVREARTFRIADQAVPVGIKRVKAWAEGGGSGGDVDANVAIIDTGVGPAESRGQPIAMTTNELNIAGGVNCFDDPTTEENEAFEFDTGNPEVYDGWYGDTQGHGTHVAGIIGARDNGIGTVGVAPGANIYSVRVFKGRATSEGAIVCGLDWVIGTHLYGYAPPIDVVNMSIQGPRTDYREDCDDIKGNLSADPMQASICVLRDDWGVPVVAAAGNDSINANESAPGGYDQVISVGAMTDTDGLGWQKGPNAGCGGYGVEKDDTYASYSNYGRDIDIVAPGTCIWSTDDDDPSGDTLVRLTGTSMAAPHVTGAVARYIDAKGSPGSVGNMRQLTRAAGTLNWDARTDPVWYGPNDSDPPNRVLDVEALTGSAAIKAFVYHDGFNVGSSVKNRTTRVDLQRSGGFAGQVNLSVSDFPSAAGNASFLSSSLSGLGPNALGTNLSFDFDGSGGEGHHTVKVDASGGGHDSVTRQIALLIDWTAPTVTDLAPRIRGERAAMTIKGKARIDLGWVADDALSGLKSAQLQRKIGSKAWKDAGVAGSSSALVWLKPGQSNQFRVKATDNVNNLKVSGSVGGRLSVRDSASNQWQPSGHWKTKKVKKAYKGSIRLATSGTATLTTTFTGKAAGIAASVGPARGTFQVRVDGGDWETAGTKAAKGGHRKVVWTTRVPYGKHTVEIQRLSGQVAIDGLLIVR